MLNIYLIYISSRETSDVNVIDKIYTSFRKATNDIDNVIQKYIKERYVENSSVIISKKDFSLKKLNINKELLVGGYCFKKKKNSATIYKKVLFPGRVWNSTQIELVGKIGILSEINIPIDNKLMRIIKLAAENIGDISNISNISDISDNIDNIDNIDDSDNSDIDNIDIDSNPYKIKTTTVSNYEHGQHVSFIQELKNKINNRQSFIINDPEPFVDTEKEKIIRNLKNTKALLNHIPLPYLQQFGEVVNNQHEESSEITWDSLDEYNNIINKEYLMENTTEDTYDSTEDTYDSTEDTDDATEDTDDATEEDIKEYNDMTDQIIEDMLKTVNCYHELGSEYDENGLYDTEYESDTFWANN